MRYYAQDLTTLIYLGPRANAFICAGINIFSRVLYRRSRGLLPNLRESQKRTLTNDKAKASQDYPKPLPFVEYHTRILDFDERTAALGLVRGILQRHGLPHLEYQDLKDVCVRMVLRGWEPLPVGWVCGRLSIGMDDPRLQMDGSAHASRSLPTNRDPLPGAGTNGAKWDRGSKGGNTSEAKKRSQPDKPPSSLIGRNIKPTSGPEFKLGENASGGTVGRFRRPGEARSRGCGYLVEVHITIKVSWAIIRGDAKRNRTKTPVANTKQDFLITVPKFRVEEGKTTAAEVVRDTFSACYCAPCARSVLKVVAFRGLKASIDYMTDSVGELRVGTAFPPPIHFAVRRSNRREGAPADWNFLEMSSARRWLKSASETAKSVAQSGLVD
ncbi:hypothetical protein B0H16DRAFT_1465617 [Mycena metata]|uniref:Uncharacterized protein n=1 Tax=Mycena metata TaxID=1033252 RepID=A0AAD7MZA8_9AGAR|nr:hypothetical protein B0H16DRAFT_1465617 [Mycena metata]